jgi:hypothetical protein
MQDVPMPYRERDSRGGRVGAAEGEEPSLPYGNDSRVVAPTALRALREGEGGG